MVCLPAYHSKSHIMAYKPMKPLTLCSDKFSTNQAPTSSLSNTGANLQEQVPSLQQQVPNLQKQVPNLQEQVPNLKQQVPNLQEQINRVAVVPDMITASAKALLTTQGTLASIHEIAKKLPSSGCLITIQALCFSHTAYQQNSYSATAHQPRPHCVSPTCLPPVHT